MANNKKITQLNNAGQLADEDVFVVVDKSTKSGPDASSSGKTAAVSFGDLKDQIGSQGEKGAIGPQGLKGAIGPQGLKGAPSSVKGPQGPKGDKSTEKGPQGEQGAASTVKGPPGPKGPQGAPSTIAGPKGPKGLQGAASTEKGPMGGKGEPGVDSTVKGPMGIKGKQGTPANSNYHLGLRGTNSAVSYVGHHLYKLKGSSGAWDAQIYSTQSYTGGCQVSFTPNNSGNISLMVGLNGSSDRTQVGFSSIDFAFYIQRGSVYMYESGTLKHPATSTTCNDSTVLSIKYDNNSITYYVDDEVVRGPVPLGKNRAFHLDSSLYGPVSGSTPYTKLLSFIPLQPGPKGEKSTEKGPKGDVGATFSYNSTTKVLTIT